VTVDLIVDDAGVAVSATVRTADRTGVEMEALTSVTVACLTLVDMTKAHDPSGPLLAALLAELGFEVSQPVVVPDDVEAVRDALRSAVRASYDVVVTT